MKPNLVSVINNINESVILIKYSTTKGSKVMNYYPIIATLENII